MAIRELLQSRGFDIQPTRITGQRKWVIDNTDIWSVPTLLGQEHPISASCLCYQIVVEPYAGVDHSDTTIPQCYIVTADYSTDEFSTDMIPIKNYSISTESVTLEAGYKFSDDSDVPNSHQSRRIGNMEVTYSSLITMETWYSIRTAIMNSQGKVNNASWDGEAAGCWLFLGAQIDKSWRMGQDGIPDEVLRIDWHFDYKREGWNNIYRVSTTQYEAVSPPIYDSADFTALGVTP